MNGNMILISLVFFVIGAIIAYLYTKSKLSSEQIKNKIQFEELEKQNIQLKVELNEAKDNANELQREWFKEKERYTELNAIHQEALKATEQQKIFLAETNDRLKEQFESLSSKVLQNNNQQFLDLAKTTLEKHFSDSKNDLDKRQQAIDSLVKPLNDSLNKFDGKIQEIEKAREGAYSEIKVFLDNMKYTTEKLQKETNTLVSALKTSHTRGKYGEIGLRRVVEFAGMSEFCDFEEQTSVQSENGLLRPDLIVNLPGKRKVIIDSKVPLNQYMMAFETEDDSVRRQHLVLHGKAVREHLKNLSSKAYWSQYNDTPDYVVMYLQIESSFGAALELDRTLIEDALNNRIIIATPTTLITMLRTIAFSWQQIHVADNIYQMRDAGIELYNRVNVLIQHFASVGHNLNQASQSYNKAIGSLESRFIPQVKKLKEIGGTLMEKEIVETKPIDTMIRAINQQE
ncbi:DNA recombination protein RmuC [Faecalibacter rhinopitheci]|uniref:DNA recombination protein RmuC n=1 Tax=Faecalibacter rhinopitheci TaxID=2779678 RepID=A0A8J7FRH0_9FLAO|nr:DNA recombination protein RmuC [Faecalibacter rhinopitheci]MBF0597163.1 DNA recombination protein RmuC [Faecalibacter rhinopitheci]